MRIAVLFAGQGSQSVGMGKDLYEKYPSAKKYFDTADEVLGQKISDLCFNGPEEELKKTENTQPAILIMSYICYKLLEESGIQADVYGGFSLGEYSALTAAGYVSFEDGIKLVRERGLIMDKAVVGMKGGMAAILGLDDAQVEDVCEKAEGIVVPANYNCPGQLVISGEMSAVENAVKLAEEAGAKKAVMLNVSGPFHSPLLSDAADKLKETLDNVDFNLDSNNKVLSNVTATYHKADEVKTKLVEQMYSPVKWTKSIENLIADGYDTFIEVGPGRVLSGFMRKIDRNVKAYNIADIASLEKTIEALKA